MATGTLAAPTWIRCISKVNARFDVSASILALAVWARIFARLGLAAPARTVRRDARSDCREAAAVGGARQRSVMIGSSRIDRRIGCRRGTFLSWRVSVVCVAAPRNANEMSAEARWRAKRARAPCNGCPALRYRRRPTFESRPTVQYGTPMEIFLLSLLHHDLHKLR